MTTAIKVLSAPWAVTRAARRWPVTTQVGARRNAMLAGTVLTERRAELLDVERFLAVHESRYARRVS
jgi:hypothetical protein